MEYDYDPVNGLGADECYLISGDSGGPSFVDAGGQLALVGIHYYNGGTPGPEDWGRFPAILSCPTTSTNSTRTWAARALRWCRSRARCGFWSQPRLLSASQTSTFVPPSVRLNVSGVELRGESFAGGLPQFNGQGQSVYSRSHASRGNVKSGPTEACVPTRSVEREPIGPGLMAEKLDSEEGRDVE